MTLHITTMRSARILGALLFGFVAACDLSDEDSSDLMQDPSDATEFREVARVEIDDGSTISFLQLGEGILVGGRFESDSTEVHRMLQLIEVWDATPLEVYQSLTDAPIPEELEENHGTLAAAGHADVQPRDLGGLRTSVWGIGAPDCSSEQDWRLYWDGIYSSYVTQTSYREPFDALDANASGTNVNNVKSHVRLGMCAEESVHTFPIFSHFTMSAKRPQDQEWITSDVVLEDGTQARYYWFGALSYDWMVETELALNTWPPLGGPGNGVAFAMRKL